MIDLTHHRPYADTMIKASKVWHNGKLIDWDDATIHVMAHALHYGSSVFEGIRCYKTARGSEIFRLPEHIARLYYSAKIYRMDLALSQQDYLKAVLETIRANGFEHCYIRPLAFRGVGAMGVNPLGNAVEEFILVWEWGKYLGEEAINEGVDVCISSWNRAAPNTFPSIAKAGGNYINGSLVKMEAVMNGFSEGIALDTSGFVSEGSGENLFLITQGKLITPPVGNAILPGITRDSVINLAREAGFEVIEQSIPREWLYTADELFLTGTAAEITPIRSVDRIRVAEGRRGPITAQLQKVFFDYVEGKVADRFGWMTGVYASTAVGSQAAD
jgi:branched-chain amino acid aminotransferase